MADEKHFYIERTPEGDFSAKRGNAQRASAIEDTQREAVKRAHEIDPDAPIHIERVRHTKAGGPDKWRRA